MLQASAFQICTVGNKTHFVGMDPVKRKLVSIVVDITSHMAINSLSRENPEEQGEAQENPANAMLNYLYHIFDKVPTPPSCRAQCSSGWPRSMLHRSGCLRTQLKSCSHLNLVHDAITFPVAFMLGFLAMCWQALLIQVKRWIGTVSCQFRAGQPRFSHSLLAVWGDYTG